MELDQHLHEQPILPIKYEMPELQLATTDAAQKDRTTEITVKGKKRQRKLRDLKEVTNCPHKDVPHYA